MHLPNIIEEIAYLYNHGALDRNVAAELLGVYVERLWKTSESLVKEIRVAEQRPRVFIEWEQMQADTWKRRGVRGPLDLAANPAEKPPKIIGSLSRLKWLLSAEYRRDTSSDR
jgi:hypothetical protein